MVQICNQNPFVTAAGQQFVLDYFRNNINENITNYDTLKQFVIINETDLYSSKGEYETLFEGLLLSGKNSDDDIKKTFGYNIEHLMLQCYFNYANCNFTKDFYWYYHHYYGNCFVYNSGFDMHGNKVELKKATTFDFESGLHFQIFLGFQREKEFGNLYSFQYSKGAFISVHDQSVFPTKFEGFEAKPGVCSVFELNKVKTYTLPAPYSTCIFMEQADPYISKKLTELNLAYRQKICLDLCIQSKLSCSYFSKLKMNFYFLPFEVFIIENCGCHNS